MRAAARGRWIGGVFLAALVVIATARAEDARPAHGAEEGKPALGSRALLETLWAADALKGTPEEAAPRRARALDPAGPAEPPSVAPPSPVPEPARNSIRRVRPANDAKLVALTFDLCEQAGEVAGYQGAIVDFLRRERVPATFFAGGKWLRTHPERAMQLMADPLFEVGNHAWSHGNLRRLPIERAQTEILWSQWQYANLRATLAARARDAGVPEAAIERVPARPRVFRFPYGVCNPKSLALANELGLAAIQWDVVSGDADPGLSAEAIARAVTAEVKPGSIVVMHANGRGHHTPEALPKIVAGLREKGFRFVTASELLAAGEPVAVEDCYERKPGDNLRYDRWGEKSKP